MLLSTLHVPAIKIDSESHEIKSESPYLCGTLLTNLQ